MKFIQFLVLNFLIVSGLSMSASQEKFDLTSKDLQACLTQDNAQKSASMVHIFLNMSQKKAQEVFKDKPCGDVLIKKIYGSLQDDLKKCSSNEDADQFFSDLRDCYAEHHITYLLSQAAIAKAVQEENLTTASSKMFFTLGSYITQPVSKNNKDATEEVKGYILQQKYNLRDEDCDTIINGYCSHLCCKLEENFIDKNIDLSQCVRGVLFTLGLQYQDACNAYNKNKEILEHKKYEKRAIVHGKIAVASVGFFTMLAGLTAWLLTLQS